MLHTTNFGPLRSLCIQLGNQSLIRLAESGSNRTYMSEQTMNEMVSAIGMVIEDSLLVDVRESPYYAIVVDDATDISVTKQLAVSITYLDGSSAVVKMRYLKLLDMSKHISATGEVISDSIAEYLRIASLSLNSLAGASCDGASVMLGQGQGAMSLLKLKAPTMIITHFTAHWLALAASDAAAASPWFQKFEKSLSATYNFFARSSVRSAELAEMQQILNHPKLKLQRPSDTRWLSLENSVHALRRSLEPVLAVLEQEGAEGDPTAIGLSKQMAKPEFLVTLYFMSDVLSTLGSLSTTFQERSLNLLAVECTGSAY